MHQKTITAVLIGALSATAGRGGASVSSLTREHDPVILDGASLPGLAGVAVDTLVAFRWSDDWIQVPVQVDERTVVDFGLVYGLDPVGILTLAYADPTTYTGPDPDPSFDADDEVVLMAADAGGRASPDAAFPEGVLNESGFELAIDDPLDGGTGFVYLFVTDGTLDPAAGRDAVTYEFNLLSGSYLDTYDTTSGPNPEDSVAGSDHYRVHFSDRWIRDETNVLTGGATGEDLLDRHKNMFGPGICNRTEETFSNGEGAFFANRDGPIRAIRSYMGANSGPLTQRDHFYYAQREDLVTHLRVHAIQGVIDLFDYAPEATDMTYRNDLNTGGVPVDGVPDAVVPGAIAWEMITGDQGSLTISWATDTNIESYAYTSYYSDDATPVVRQCTGDDSEYATSGPWVDQGIPSTDPLLGSDLFLATRRIIYYEAPGVTPAEATARHAQATTGLDVAVAPFEGGTCPADLDGSGAVDFGDILAVLAAWGPCDACPEDLDGSGAVDFGDILAVLASWGPCG